MKNTKTEKNFKRMPHFKGEEQEGAFWADNDTADYLDWSKAEKVKFPNLKPTTKSISIRLPVSLLDNLKTIANKMDVPYQSLIKMFLDKSVKERIDTEHPARERKAAG